ncbi:MAG: hypothetical protein Q4E05_01530 [Pseudoclavibacter sp.]|nr:hypothetical protein [Pseudoclavibacter sp.]
MRGTGTPKGVERSIDIFTELGWAQAPAERLAGLPLGSPARRREALAGLREGEWTRLVPAEDGRGAVWERRSRIGDVDLERLALFAIRLGVDARRAHELLARGRLDPGLVTGMLAGRGRAFAARFVEVHLQDAARMREPAPSRRGGICVRLVQRLRLPIPEEAGYLLEWSALAARPEAAELLSARAAEHLRLGVRLGLGAAGPFGTAFPAVAAAGGIGRQEAVSLAAEALARARRHEELAAWTGLLLDGLAAGPAELARHAERLAPVPERLGGASAGRLGAALVARVEEPRLPSVLDRVLEARPREARLAALTAAAGRSAPSARSLAACLPVLGRVVQDDPDPRVRRAVEALREAWGAPPQRARTAPVRGLWRATPRTWRVPRFEAAPDEADALPGLAGRMREAWGDPLPAERFHDALVRAAHRDLDGVRRELAAAGLRRLLVPGPHEREDGPRLSPLRARRSQSLRRLGRAPGLLSTPSRVDGSVDPEDLLDRLERYRALEVAADEADLLVALLRLEHSAVEAGHRHRAGRLDVPIRSETGRRAAGRAGEIVARALEEPPAPLRLEPGEDGSLRASLADAEHGPRGLPSRWRAAVAAEELPALLPAGGEAALTALRRADPPPRRLVGLARHAARSREPLGPGAAVNLLAALPRRSHPASAPVAEAIVDAWRRGLLRPGTARLELLDWRTDGPDRLRDLVRALLELSDRGPLPVVWPLLADVVELAAAARRPLTGAAEAVSALHRLLPEAQEGVRTGRAEAGTVELPGVRRLAEREGASLAVLRARELSPLLPEPSEASRSAAPAPRFLWRVPRPAAPPRPDGARTSLEPLDPASGSGLVLVRIELPGPTPARYSALPLSLRTLASEGRLRVLDDRNGQEAWLRWRAEARGGRGGLVAESPERAEQGIRPREEGARAAVPRLSTALVTAALAGLCHRGRDPRTAASEADELLRRAAIPAEAIRAALMPLLRRAELAAAPLARFVDTRPDALAVMWPLYPAALALIAAAEAPPRWAGRVLRSALEHAPTLREAVRRGLVPGERLLGQELRELADRPTRSAVVRDARELVRALEA